MGVARGPGGWVRTTPLLGKICEIDRENPLHRKNILNKSLKLTMKIRRDFIEIDPPFQNPGDAPVNK
jgi:hypothetical protein